MKVCPHCAEMVQDDARVCKHCHRNIPSKLGQWIPPLAAVLAVALTLAYLRPLNDDVTAMEGALVDDRQASAPSHIDLTQAYAESSWQAHCAGRYPDNFTMRAACGRNSMRGYQDFVAIRAHYEADPAMMLALAGCYADYTMSGVTDFSMAGACARNQERGYLEVNQ